MEIKNMERIMQNVLKFRCEIVKDPDFDEINEIIEEAATFLGKYSESFYCFTFFIMGHGNTVSIVILLLCYVIHEYLIKVSFVARGK